MAYFKLEYLSFYTQDNTSKYIANTIGEFTSQAAINTQNKSTEELKKAFSETCDYLSSFKFNQSNFCFCFDEKFSIQTHSQCSLTFSMMEYVLLNGQRFKNPFVSVLQPGSLVLLTTQEGDEYLLNIESRSLDISETNSKYTYTCADNFTYTLSKQETAYEIENNSDDEDYIGAKTVDWWAYKITQETKIPYKYLPLQWSYSTHGTNYPASLQSKVSYSKPAENDTTNENYTLFQTTAFSGSGSANSILITLAELYGLMIKTKIVFDRSIGTIDYYYWFETMKNSNWTGLSYTLDSTISNFTISEKMDSFGSILNVTGGTIGDDQVTLLPEITPFFSNLFLSQAWTKDNFYQNYFTSVVEYGDQKIDNTTSNWHYIKSYSLNGVETSGFKSESFTLPNNSGYNYLRCANDKFNKYSTLTVIQDGQILSSRVNDYYIIPQDSEIAYEEHEEIPSQYHNVSFQVFIPCTIDIISEGAEPFEVSLYCQWMRNPTEEDLAYAQAADRCPWLENRLIDFSYFYDHNIINKTTLSEMNNYLKQDLRYINGKLAVYLNQYYTAVHKKTTVLADITNNLDLIGANFASAVTDYYRTKGTIGDISTTSSLYSTYSDVFANSDKYQSTIINYSDTISDYVNKFFDSQQRFLKNIKSFTDYFNEPYSTTSSIQLTQHAYQIVNKDTTKGYSFTTPKYVLLNASEIADYVDDNGQPTIPIFKKLSGSSKYECIEPSDFVTMANLENTDAYKIYTPIYNKDNYTSIATWNDKHKHYIQAIQSLEEVIHETQKKINGCLVTQYPEFGTATKKISYAGGYYQLEIYNNNSSIGTVYYKGTSTLTQSDFENAVKNRLVVEPTLSVVNGYLQVSEQDLVNYLYWGVIPHDDVELNTYYVLDKDIQHSALNLMKYLLCGTTSKDDADTTLNANAKAILTTTGTLTNSPRISNMVTASYFNYKKTDATALGAIGYAAQAYFHALPLSDLTINIIDENKKVVSTQSSHYITANNYDQYYRFISSRWLWSDVTADFKSEPWKFLSVAVGYSIVYAIGNAVTNNDGSMGRSGSCFEDIKTVDVCSKPTKDFVSIGASFWDQIVAKTRTYHGIYATTSQATTPAFAWFDLALAALSSSTYRKNLINTTNDVDVTYTTANLQWLNPKDYILGTNKANVGIFVFNQMTQYTLGDEITVGKDMTSQEAYNIIEQQLYSASNLDYKDLSDTFVDTTNHIYDSVLINSLSTNITYGVLKDSKYEGMTIKEAYLQYLANLKTSDTTYKHKYTITLDKDGNEQCDEKHIEITDKYWKEEEGEEKATSVTYYVIFFEKLSKQKHLKPKLPSNKKTAQTPSLSFVNNSYLVKSNIKTSIFSSPAVLSMFTINTDPENVHYGIYTQNNEITETNSWSGAGLITRLKKGLNITDDDKNNTLLTTPAFYRKDVNGNLYRVYSIYQYQQQEVYFTQKSFTYYTVACDKDELEDTMELVYFTQKDDNSFTTEKKTVPLSFEVVDKEKRIYEAKIDDNTIIRHSLGNSLSFDNLTNGQVCYVLSNMVDTILTKWGVSTENRTALSDATYELSALIETNLETYWTSAYNASLYCDYYIPENWTSYANSSANYFYQYLFNFHSVTSGGIQISIPTINGSFIPQVIMVNKPQQKLKKYTLKHYTGGKAEDVSSDIELLIDYNQDPSWAITNTSLNETVQDKTNKLQSVFGFTTDELDEWYVVESGYANYYEAISGGMKWNEVIPFLNGSGGNTVPMYDKVNGLYAMTIDVLHNYYKNATTTLYEKYRKLQQEAWRAFYQKYSGLIIEQSYENTDALTSEELYNFAYAQFKDINKPEYDFSATVIEATKLKGYTGQELHIGDPIKIEMQSVMDAGKDNISLQQLLYISGINYSLRKDSSTELTLNTLKYNDKLAQKLARLIK